MRRAREPGTCPVNDDLSSHHPDWTAQAGGHGWTVFLRALKSRGLAGATGDLRCPRGAAHRDRGHPDRRILAQVPRGLAEMVAAAVRTIFAQPDAEHDREQMFGPRASGALPLQRNKDRGG